MRIAKWMICFGMTVVACSLAAREGTAANISITWLNYTNTAINGTVPNNSVYYVPGIGNVTVTYSFPNDYLVSRSQDPNDISGNVSFGGNTYSWTNYEHFGTYFTDGALGPQYGTVTYSFTSLLPAGSVYIGTIGLGATTSEGGGQSSTVVNQNGTFLGDFNAGEGFATSAWTGGAGTFTVKNSQTGAGGYDPWWNTQLGVTRIDDAVTSITVTQGNLRGDGIGVNIGFTPEIATGTKPTGWGRLKGLYR